jgi:hypothetical protein
MPPNTWPIIIGGCHRSGTSLLRRILNARSRIHCGPEIKFLRDFHGDYYGDPSATDASSGPPVLWPPTTS